MTRSRDADFVHLCQLSYSFVDSTELDILRTVHDGAPNPFGALSAPIPTPISFVACCASFVLTPLWSGLLLALALLRSRSSVDPRGAVFSLGFAQVLHRERYATHFFRSLRRPCRRPVCILTPDPCVSDFVYCFPLDSIAFLYTQLRDSRRRIRRPNPSFKGTTTSRPG